MLNIREIIIKILQKLYSFPNFHIVCPSGEEVVTYLNLARKEIDDFPYSRRKRIHRGLTRNHSVIKT